MKIKIRLKRSILYPFVPIIFEATCPCCEYWEDRDFRPKLLYARVISHANQVHSLEGLENDNRPIL